MKSSTTFSIIALSLALISVSLIGIMQTASAKHDTNAGLVAHWKFDKGKGTTAKDSSGNGNTGTLTNGPAWLDRKECAIGKSCLDFDGVDDYVSVRRSSSIEPSSAITITMWVNADVPRGALIDKAFTSHTNPFYSYNVQLEPKAGDATKAELIWALTTNGVVTFMGEGSSEVLIDLNSWQFVSVVYDGSQMKEYVNGVLKGSVPNSGTISYYDMPLLIGKYNNVDFYTNAKIDDVSIYNRALSASEVHSIYSNSLSHFHWKHQN